jgi:uncharacterized OsmC-like protein
MAPKSVTVRASYASQTKLSIENLRGASLDVALSPSASGFSPLELQASSLAACIAMSVKIAARQEQLPPLEQVAVEVGATKAVDEPSRLRTFSATVTISDPLPPGKSVWSSISPGRIPFQGSDTRSHSRAILENMRNSELQE